MVREGRLSKGGEIEQGREIKGWRSRAGMTNLHELNQINQKGN